MAWKQRRNPTKRTEKQGLISRAGGSRRAIASREKCSSTNVQNKLQLVRDTRQEQHSSHSKEEERGNVSRSKTSGDLLSILSSNTHFFVSLDKSFSCAFFLVFIIGITGVL